MSITAPRTWIPSRARARAAFAVAAATALMALAGCSGDDGGSAGDAPASATASGDAEPARSMAVNYNISPATLDPGNLCNTADGIVRNLYSSLVKFGTKEGPHGTLQTDQDKIEPDLAESWEVSDDGTVYTFHIRPGVTFASGEPADARAVEFSWKRVRKMGLCSAFGIETADGGNVKSFGARDASTFVVEMKEPNPALIKSWATATMSIVDPSVVKANGGVTPGEPNEYLATHAAGTGPYRVAEYRPNQRLTMEANPDYYGDPPLTERITVNFVTDDSTLLLQARDGTADVTLGLPKVGVESLQDDPGVTVATYRSTNTEQVVLNWDHPPFDDRDVREALGTSVPYEDLVETVARGLAQPFTGPILPTMPGFVEELGGPHVYDLERARELIERSGVELPIRFTLNIPQGNSVQEQLATILQDAWREIDVEMKIRKLDQAAYTAALFGNEAAASIRHDGPFVNDPDYYLGYDMQCAQPGTENTGNICIPKADEALERARRALDEEERLAAYREVIEHWQPEEPKIFLYLDEEAAVLSQRVTDYAYDPALGQFALMAAEAE